MIRYALFTDVSVNPRHRVGVGGYLIVSLSNLETEADSTWRDDTCTRLKTRRFTETSSTRLEVQTVLWALESVREEHAGSPRGSLTLYTDSQCVAGLPGRRSGLIETGFSARHSGKPLANAPLYREFYEAYDRLGFQLIRLPGHSPAGTRSMIQRIFSDVDRGVRKELKSWMESDT